jgi:hypothetical protein
MCNGLMGRSLERRQIGKRQLLPRAHSLPLLIRWLLALNPVVGQSGLWSSKRLETSFSLTVRFT